MRRIFFIQSARTCCVSIVFPFLPLLFTASVSSAELCCCRPHPSTEEWWRGPTTVSTHTGRWYPPNQTGIRGRYLTGGPPPFNQQVPHLLCSCVFMFVQLNKCVVVCGSVLQRGHSDDGCLTCCCCRPTPPVCSCGGVRQLNFSREALPGVSST